MASSKEKLAALKAQYGSQDNAGGGNREGFVNNYYPFWNMKTGQRCVIRFLPDKADDNPRGFMVEKSFHNLTIAGAKKTVPCLKMYGDEDCPVCKVSQEYYKAKDDVNGKKYWRKKQYIAQALVIEDPLEADKDTGETHAGKVRYITLSYQIYNIIKEAFASEDDPLEGIPYDFEDGYDFIIKKTEQGQYASYATGTKFVSKQRALSEDELVTVEEGMAELTTLLPKHPGLEKVQAMLNADLNGEAYDDGKSAPTLSKPAASKPAPAKAVKPAAEDEEDDLPFTPDPKPAAKPVVKPTPAAADDSSTDVDDMLAAIRARRQAK